MKKYIIGLLFFMPFMAQAAMTQVQIDALLGMIKAFGADSIKMTMTANGVDLFIATNSQVSTQKTTTSIQTNQETQIPPLEVVAGVSPMIQIPIPQKTFWLRECTDIIHKPYGKFYNLVTLPNESNTQICLALLDSNGNAVTDDTVTITDANDPNMDIVIPPITNNVSTQLLDDNYKPYKGNRYSPIYYARYPLTAGNHTLTFTGSSGVTLTQTVNVVDDNNQPI